jgi:hypothetical protein
MFIDAIHVHVEERGKHDKIKCNIVPETDECLRAMHESRCYVKPPYTE